MLERTMSTSVADMPQSKRLAVMRWRQWLREPLLHFVLIGAALFVGGDLYRQHTSTYRIEMTPQRVAQLAKRYELQFGITPSPDTLWLLIDEDIHDEILFREGLHLKLDQDDEIVRRRIVQKTKFLLQDTHAPQEPTREDLERYYQRHRAHYIIPQRASFSHIYFSGDGGDQAARAHANAVLTKLTRQTKRAPQLGDAFPDLYDFAAYEPEQIARLFGHTELAQAVMSAPIGRWSGPFRSAYGWHLLYVEMREPSRQPSLDEVREQVRTDYLLDAQTRANAAAFDEVARKFTVVREAQ